MRVKDLIKGVEVSEFNVLLKHVRPSDSYGGIKVPEITTWRYCDVIDFVSDGTVSGIAAKVLKCTEEELMEMPGKGFLSLLKHLKNEADKIGKLEDQLKSDPDPDLMSAGIEKLNPFGVMTVYYSISSDPRDWDEISELPYNKLWTRLMIDKINKEVQKEYDRIMQWKTKNK
ncbi:hypothetical protein [Parapedobacter lycopersici]|uniref:hypothetical protein n=1 Tax=Parapedobacter lycopersici TaxID=1864939 RepID=UPI00214D6CCA|nr:hypothetical protein [Parapedobacter lycopersici]